MTSIPADIHESDFEKHSEVLGDGGLRHVEAVNDVSNGSFLGSEKGEDVASARLGDGVEGIGGGGGSRHAVIIFLYRNMSSTNSQALTDAHQASTD
jgi:hypothetical protein